MTEEGLLPIGTILSERYKITGIIGRGGFGTVYLAHQLNMNRDVAVKVLPKQFMSMDNVVERFRREAKLASRLSHPNTITLFDYGSEDDKLYIVMELLKGKDLADLLHDEGFLPTKRVIKIVVQVLKSLREAHAYGIIHRDLKPENIFVSSVSGEQDVVKVLDFGIAKFLSADQDMPTTASRPGGSPRNLTRAGSTIGTPAYMSPEQAAGDELGPQSDLYSLGIIMYEALSGELPFPDDDVIKTMRAHLFEDVPPLRVPGVSGTRLEFVIKRALAKEVGDRFSSADEMLKAIEGDPYEESSSRLLQRSSVNLDEDPSSYPDPSISGLGGPGASNPTSVLPPARAGAHPRRPDALKSKGGIIGASVEEDEEIVVQAKRLHYSESQNYLYMEEDGHDFDFALQSSSHKRVLKGTSGHLVSSHEENQSGRLKGVLAILLIFVVLAVLLYFFLPML